VFTKTNTLTFVFLFALFVSFEARGQVWFEDGEPVPDTEWRRTAGTLGVMQLLTPEPDKLMENWNQPGDPLDVITGNKTPIGKPITAVILFTGCKANEKGNCNIVGAFQVLDPAGNVYANTGPLPLWNDKPAPGDGILQLGENFLGVIIEPDDLLGEYLVYAAVRDLNSGNQTITLQRFTAVENE
jgi:hypothetical protein